MLFFKPTYVFNDITGITVRFLKKMHIRGIILDIDNTLTTHNNPIPQKSSIDWLTRVKKAGIKLIIVSNNKPPRVEPFARLLDLDYVANGRKPLTYGINEAVKRLGENKCDIAAIGDQIFTDIMGANLAGVRSCFVYPLEPETSLPFRIKRTLEKPLLPSRKQIIREV